ncbi:uncharacterized protein ColSpa_00015 [Colletotrichum spaethianum]|uniref:Uncharacterized protein n=1 Tax=Colletotrichum spaethianum TaxID=700344 RepID=A0AA37L3G4_9PEZI|nr:uncharacterized protein ColSpa_00015 [Colletotrichum spaethianum]GKT39834.1 hypothetical protein ColSpa_00015 [Colletotrichum spaethianum]
MSVTAVTELKTFQSKSTEHLRGAQDLGGRLDKEIVWIIHVTVTQNSERSSSKEKYTIIRRSLTVAEIISEAPLSNLASYSRQMTNGVTGEMLASARQMLAPIRNKGDLSIRVNSFPPISLVLTDWRDADVCTADFGFAKPTTFRHLFDTVTEGMTIVYPTHNGPAGSDEGIGLQVTFEKEPLQQLVDDPEWN